MRRRYAFLILSLFVDHAAAAVIEGAALTKGPSRIALPALESILARTSPAIRSVRLELGNGAAESFSIRKVGDAAVVTGADHTGLGYGIYELAAQLAAGGEARDVARSAEVEIRSVALFLYNRDLEREWFYSEDFWRRYFALLARARFNRISLIFGHQTSYFAPLFPFLVEVPGYERVKVPSFTPEERRRNLEMLRTITELADEHGIRFVLGVWQQHAHLYGKNLVDNLPYEDLFDYCPKALALILRAVPKIHGVQFRMNIESGIEEDDQNRFYTAMSKAILSVGRPIAIDYRAKGLRPETIESAVALGIRPTVSNKYWREHMGLPYQSTRIDAPDKARSYRRYGYWDTLYQNRPYDVLHRMWTLGSHKILLWGSLDYARQFAESSHLGDGRGLEICASLSQKGFGNFPGGNWRIFAKPELEYFRWEFERYWAYYLTFGLAAYSRDSSQPVLDAEFQRRFGKASGSIRKAYDAASWVIPYLTAVRAVSNSNFGYWPEMEAGGLMDRYIETGTGDDNRFYSIGEYVTDSLARRFSAKTSPEEMASQLERWAVAAGEAMKSAGDVPSESGKELASTRVDIGVLAALARYHAARLRAGVEYEFFTRGGQRQRLTSAVSQFRHAVGHWKEIARLTDGYYYANMVFNRPPEQIGHWKDELPFLENELTRLTEIDRLYRLTAADPAKALEWKIEQPRHKLTMRAKETAGTWSRWADLTPVAEPAGAPADRYTQMDPAAAVQDVLRRQRYARILHTPVRFATEREPLHIHASLLGKREGTSLTVNYRLSGNGFSFQTVEMKADSTGNEYSAAIPAARAGDTILYFIQARDGTTHTHGSRKEPHTVALRAAVPVQPVIQHADVTSALVGKSLPVVAKVRTGLPPASVRLHYRHLDQAEDWIVRDMQATGSSGYNAEIPGEFIVPGWDLMYTIEVVDSGGTGEFYPNARERNPFVVVSVKGGH
ncbi:MAG: hypothetical protein ACKV2U_02970 [Bryobacteraceae bacterium]